MYGTACAMIAPLHMARSAHALGRGRAVEAAHSRRNPSTVARPRFRRRVAAQALPRHVTADRKASHVFERAERLGDEVPFAVADLTFAIGHGGRAMQYAPGGA